MGWSWGAVSDGDEAAGAGAGDELRLTFVGVLGFGSW